MVTEDHLADQAGFARALRDRFTATRSRLCIGLDPDPDRLPAGVPPTAAGMLSFCRSIVDATDDVAAAFKVNFAFFEAAGPDGWKALADLRAAIPSRIPIIADAKRGDIGNTSRAYARAILDVLGYDAVTVNPYLGWDSLDPFFACRGKGIFVLCKTSNPGSADLQDLVVDSEHLYERVARQVVALDVPAEVGLVVGATFPSALGSVRHIAPESLLLVPGSGAQGGSVAEALAAAGGNTVFTISRDILYASSGPDFASAARERAVLFARQTWDAVDERR